jgi:(p)ppGpp synthase/HD superfamily hydrolase
VPEPVPAPSFLKALPLARRALAYASRLHSGQRRASDDAPFIVHPLEVASLLHSMGYPDHVVAAAILHDSIENTAAELDDIAHRVGQHVAILVQAVTEDAAIERYAERKARLRRQIADVADEARAIYAADKVTRVANCVRRRRWTPRCSAPVELR